MPFCLLLLLQVPEMLDRLYHVLDNLALRHHLFKVETIGCTHVVVGNLQTPQPDHASKAAWFALDAHKAAQSILVSTQDPSLGSAAFVVRFEFHGPHHNACLLLGMTDTHQDELGQVLYLVPMQC